MAHAQLESAARALEALDVDGVVAAYSDRFVFEDTAAGITISERAHLRAYFKSLFSMPEAAFTDVVVFDDGRGHGAGEWLWSGVDAAGNSFTVKGSSIFELDETGITRETIYYLPPGASA